MSELTPYEKYPRQRPFRISKEIANYLSNKSNADYRLNEDRIYARVLYKKHLLPWPWKDYYYLQFVNTKNPFMGERYPSLYDYPSAMMVKVI